MKLDSSEPKEDAAKTFNFLPEDSPQARMAKQKIEQLRQQLLDLSSRNRFLNFQHAARRGRFVRIIDESINEMFSHISDGKQFELVAVPEPAGTPDDENNPRFKETLEVALLTDKDYLKEVAKLEETAGDKLEASLQDAERKVRDRLRIKLKMPSRDKAIPTAIEQAHSCGLKPEYDLRSNVSTRARNKNDFQTLLWKDQLDRQLAAIEKQDREARQEYGVHTLHLILGFLEWRPIATSGESGEILFSPLILQPLTVEKTRRGRRGRTAKRMQPDGSSPRKPKERYIFRANELEEPAFNLTLQERIRQDYGLLLPSFDPDSRDLETFFEEVRLVIQEHRNWRVRTFATVTHLSFSRLPIWRDLSPDNKDGIPVFRHPGVAEIFYGREVSEGAKSGKSSASKPGFLPLILDCDSSQYAAIQDVLSGRNLVVQGPPGTGKSQTITNLIAAAMEKGKTVLFVAEKLVALQVVQNRLREAGLEDFVLELHSTKVQKKLFYQKLGERLNRPKSGSVHADERQRQRRNELAQKLDIYARALNRPFGITGWTPQQILGKEFAYRDLKIPYSVAGLDFAQMVNWTSEAWRICQEKMVRWGEIRATWIEESKAKDGTLHPWHWISANNVDAADRPKIIAVTHRLSDHLQKLEKLFETSNLTTCADLKLLDIGKLKKMTDELETKTKIIDPRVLQLASTDKDGCIPREVFGANASRSIILSELSKLAPGLTTHIQTQEQPLKEMKEDLASLGSWYSAVSPSDFRTQKKLVITLLENFDQFEEQVHDLARILSIEVEVINANHLEVLRIYLNLLTRAPVSLFDRQNSLFKKGSLRTLNDALIELRALIEQTELAQRKLNVPLLSIKKLELEEAIRVISSGSLISPLTSSAYRRCRKYQRDITTQKVKKADGVRFLREVDAILDRWSEFDSHPATAVVDGLFCGVKTDLKEVEAVVEWAKLVDSKKARLKLLGLEIGDRLGPLDSATNAYLVPLDTGGFGTILQQLGKACSGIGCDLGSLKERLRSEVEVIDRVLERAKRWSIKPDLTVQTLDTVLEFARKAYSEEETLSRLSDHRWIEEFEPTIFFNQFAAASSTINLLDSSLVLRKFKDRLLSEEQADALDEVIFIASGAAELVELISKEVNALTRHCVGEENLWDKWSSKPLKKALMDVSRALHAENTLETHCKYLGVCKELSTLHLDRHMAIFPKELPEGYSNFGELFDRLAVRALADIIFKELPELGPFKDVSPSKIQEDFRNLDRDLKDLDAKEIERKLIERPIEPGISYGNISNRTELSLIEYQCRLKSPRTPLRDLLRRSSKALLSLKPCFMMSPLSVAQLLDRNQFLFDLVVFDEASQIRPEDAISAMARARQFVVVGDQMQLPPTNFGMKTVGVEEDEEDGGVDETPVVESILELSAAAYPSSRMLLWHYRSRDPSLIAFSNKEFYQKLHIFPASFRSSKTTGIRYVHVNGIYSERTNSIEAKACVEAAINYMNDFPGRSLGIVALNRPQADLIELELELKLGESSLANEYREKWAETLEPIFVKNLESVQGDERDAIFISTVFGPDEAGNFYQRFGPINSKTGHRRLNVLFTRAKYQIVLFSSIPVEKIALAETSNWGLKILKDYLSYARSGQLVRPVLTRRPTDSPFEDAVKLAIESKGYQCETQVGVTGFFIDLAVRNPSDPDGFLLGIECDGANYHSSPEARGRDRLRQEILENLDWKIARVWSTDWYRDPSGELEKLMATISRLAGAPTSEKDAPILDLIKVADEGSKKRIQEAITGDPPRKSTPNNPVAELPTVIETLPFEFSGLVEEAITATDDPFFTNMIKEAFDFGSKPINSIEIRLLGDGIMADLELEEKYYRTIKEWFEEKRYRHLRELPWISNTDDVSNIRLRINAIKNVIYRLTRRLPHH